MTDTRPEMTRAQFEAAAAYAYDGHWLTGEERFVHVPSVMQIEGWNIYGRSGNRQLTEAQRVLMMWSDLVGQTANGGFGQFADNLEYALPFTGPLMEQLEWPDLWAHLEPALAEQRALLKALHFRENWFTFDRSFGLIARSRTRMIEQLAKANTRLNPFKRAAEKARLEALTNDQLTQLHDQAVAAGTLSPDPVRSSSSMEDAEEPNAPASEAFDNWLYRDATKATSRSVVGDYIRRNRDQLVRLTD